MAAVRGGLSVGIEQPVYRGATITPFLGLRYAFKVYYLETKVSKGDVSASGDRVSGIEGEYGLTARYRDVWVGPHRVTEKVKVCDQRRHDCFSV